MCLTNGQWLQMNITTVPLPPFRWSSEKLRPLTVSDSVKAGARVPSGSMFEGVWAMAHWTAPGPEKSMQAEELADAGAELAGLARRQLGFLRDRAGAEPAGRQLAEFLGQAIV